RTYRLPFSPCGRRWRAAPDEGFSRISRTRRQPLARPSCTLSLRGRGQWNRACGTLLDFVPRGLDRRDARIRLEERQEILGRLVVGAVLEQPRILLDRRVVLLRRQPYLRRRLANDLAQRHEAQLCIAAVDKLLRLRDVLAGDDLWRHRRRQ